MTTRGVDGGEKGGMIVRFTATERSVIGAFSVLLLGVLAWIGSQTVAVRDAVQVLVVKDGINGKAISDLDARIRFLEIHMGK